MKKLIDFINCRIFKNHKWTSAVMEGKKATPEQLANGDEGFWDYATMYCRICGEESDLSKAMKLRAKHETQTTNQKD